jgi:hypothetical protein
LIVEKHKGKAVKAKLQSESLIYSLGGRKSVGFFYQRRNSDDSVAIMFNNWFHYYN